jgi:hypothetical protein
MGPTYRPETPFLKTGFLAVTNRSQHRENYGDFL